MTARGKTASSRTTLESAESDAAKEQPPADTHSEQAPSSPPEDQEEESKETLGGVLPRHFEQDDGDGNGDSGPQHDDDDDGDELTSFLVERRRKAAEERKRQKEATQKGKSFTVQQAAEIFDVNTPTITYSWKKKGLVLFKGHDGKNRVSVADLRAFFDKFKYPQHTETLDAYEAHLAKR